MNNKLSKIKCIAIFLAGISAASIPSMANADWSIVGLGTLGGIESGASDINDSGQVVGYYYKNGTTHAFITGSNGVGMTDIGTLGGVPSQAFSINNSGQVVGYYRPKDSDIFQAFITGANGVGIVDLGTSKFSVATSINNSGQVVGYDLSSFSGSGFITGPNGIGMTSVGTSSSNYSINDSGQVAGTSLLSSDPLLSHAFITGANGVGMTDLGASGGNFATGINNSGQVVGGMDRNTYTLHGSHAFITGANGVGVTDLGTMGGDWSVANSINDSGQVVGVAGYDDWVDVSSFIYSNGVMVNLSYLDAVITGGWTGLVASGINNNGQIVGHGTLHGVNQAFLLSGADQTEFFLSYTPFSLPLSIPEPETYAMLLAGLGLVGFMARRRKETAQFNLTQGEKI